MNANVCIEGQIVWYFRNLIWRIKAVFLKNMKGNTTKIQNETSF